MKLDFRVDLVDNLVFHYSSQETWNVNCPVAVLSGVKPSLTRFISSSFCNGSANLPFLFSERDKQHFFMLGLPAAMFSLSSLSSHKMLNEHHTHKTWYKPFKPQFLCEVWNTHSGNNQIKALELRPRVLILIVALVYISYRTWNRGFKGARTYCIINEAMLNGMVAMDYFS